jgi:hypothetical protein
MTEFWDNVPSAVDMRGEAIVERLLIFPLLSALAYDASDIDSKYPVEFQQGRQPGRKPEADIVCFRGSLIEFTHLAQLTRARPGRPEPRSESRPLAPPISF